MPRIGTVIREVNHRPGAGLLHSAGPRHAPAALAGYREHAGLTPAELGRAGGRV